MKNKTSKMLLSTLLGTLILVSPTFTSNSYANPRTDDMKDVRADHWSYNAIKALVDKYEIMGGFPDGTFRGTRTFSRYEAAAALYKVMIKVEEMMGRIPQQPVSNNQPQPVNPTPINYPSVSSDDLRLIRDLRDEFRREIDALKFANADKDTRLKKLEEELTKVKSDLGKVKFGGGLDVGFDDTWEDTFRPAYYSNYTLDTNISVTDVSSISAKYEGKFSSEQTEKDDNGKKTRVDKEESSIGYAQALFNYSPKGLALNPVVKFGYAGLWSLISSGTSVKSIYPPGTSVANAGPNLNKKNRGIRTPKTVVSGLEMGNGPFSFVATATPNLFSGQLKADFGALKLKMVADADQSMFIGEIVKDPIHNETFVADFKTDNFGISGQASFRAVADDFKFKASSGLAYLKLFGAIEIGGSAKYESEANEQLIVGGFLSTPDKIGNTTIPSLTFSIQEPLTIINGSLYEGSNIGDTAGIYASLSYDNPYIPGFSVYFDQKSKILFSADPKDTIATTYGVSASVGF